MTVTTGCMGKSDIEQGRQRLGRIGIWSMELRGGEPGQAADAAAELDDLGFGAVWVPGVLDGDLLNDVSRLLAATHRITIATGILNIWKHDARDVSAWWHSLPDSHKSRLLLGLGVSHGAMIGAAYGKPLGAMTNYLDQLSKRGVPADRICLAALGPKMLQLARERTAGAHPYLVTPKHTVIARAALGPDALLAPEQGVVLETDAARARDIARRYVQGYGALANYANSWRRLGFSEEDLAGPSDRLVDALFAWGGMDKIADRVNAHLDAGADHVCLQVVGAHHAPGVDVIRPAWRKLAASLL